MKRRSFLQAFAGIVASVFAPVAGAKKPVVDLSEAALEDMIIEINQFRSATGDLIAIKPTRVWCYPEDRNAAFKLMADQTKKYVVHGRAAVLV